MNTKIITYYLPQFHSIPENDEVWGEGFTEWNSVKGAEPYFKGHNQPRIPQDNNYYSLLNEDTLVWQTKIAKRAGVYGFCIYHYWFSGKKLLNKPLELIRDSPKVNFPYCISWANENWTDAWVATGKPKTFLEQKYGSESEWVDHFNYLLTFFKDPNYIVENNKPLLVLYRPEKMEHRHEMLSLWNDMAKKEGFSGISYAYQQLDFELSGEDDYEFDYSIEYQPKYALNDFEMSHSDDKKGIRELVRNQLKKSTLLKKTYTNHFKKPRILSYDELAKLVVKRKPNSSKSVAGMFVGYDDTPRKKNRGMVIQSTPDEFKKYLHLQLENVRENYQSDYLFMFAWNEWAESGYLEPDSVYHSQYLHIIHDELIIDQKKRENS